MDALQDLITEIKRLQLMVCLYQRDELRVTEPVPLDAISKELQISTDECGTVAQHLVAKGFVECTRSAEELESERVRLTNQGRRWVESMGNAGLPHLDIARHA